jgi:hypothetical protein
VTDPSLHAIDAPRRAARDRASGRLAAMTAVLAMAVPAFGLVAQTQAPARPPTPATRTQAPAAPVLKDTVPYKSMVYNVAFAYPKKDWVAVPAAGGNIALLMHKKGEASLALDFQLLRVALAPDEIDDTFKEIELEALAQRAPHARVTSSALDALGGNKVVIVKYGASGLSGDLDVTQYSIVSGASLYRLTCAATRATAARHASACETVARTLVVGK